MEDREFIFFAGAVIVLAGMHMLHTWMISRTVDVVADLQADVRYLKDNTVATEART
jgi:hypothetical protein